MLLVFVIIFVTQAFLSVLINRHVSHRWTTKQDTFSSVVYLWNGVINSYSEFIS